MENYILNLSKEDRIKFHNLYNNYISNGYLEDDDPLRLAVESLMKDKDVCYAMFLISVQYFMFEVYRVSFEEMIYAEN